MPHAFGMLGRGFVTMTVPAMKIDGRRVQGPREISRALDELVPQPALFPADPLRRQAGEDADFQIAPNVSLLRRFDVSPRSSKAVPRRGRRTAWRPSSRARSGASCRRSGWAGTRGERRSDALRSALDAVCGRVVDPPPDDVHPGAL